MADRSPDANDAGDVNDAGRLRELRRVAALGQALLKAKHDLNNLFHVAGGWSRLLRDPRTNFEQMQEGVDAVLTATQHVSHLIGGILSLEGPSSDAVALCDLAEKVSEIARGLSLLLPSPDQLILEVHTRSLVLCNFSEVLGALLSNVARRHAQPSPKNLAHAPQPTASHDRHITPRERNPQSHVGLVPNSPPAALEALLAHDWPGNVRELENVIERAVVLNSGEVITVEALPSSLRSSSSPPRNAGTTDLPLVEARARFERRYLNDMLQAASGNLSAAAKQSGMDRSNFRRLLRRHGVGVGRPSDTASEPPSGEDS